MNTTEMATATDDLVLPLGTRDDGTPIRISQSRESNVGVFGGAGSGKSVLLAQMIRAALRQNATVLVADAMTDPDLRKLAPGLAHYSAGYDAALHRTMRYVLTELDRRAHGGGDRRPMLLVLHEVPAWLHGLMQHGDPDARAGAETTLTRINRIAAQGRAAGVHLLTVGQLAPASVFGGSWLNNTGTIAVLGQPTHQLRTLFPADQLDRVRSLSSKIGRGERGRGIVLNAHTGDADLFRTTYTAADETQPVPTPEVARFGWKFPTGDEPGADGSWHGWTPVSNPSSDSLPVIELHDSDAAIFNPTSQEYQPSAPLRATHLNDN